MCMSINIFSEKRKSCWGDNAGYILHWQSVIPNNQSSQLLKTNTRLMLDLAGQASIFLFAFPWHARHQVRNGLGWAERPGQRMAALSKHPNKENVSISSLLVAKPNPGCIGKALSGQSLAGDVILCEGSCWMLKLEEVLLLRMKLQGLNWSTHS